MALLFSSSPDSVPIVVAFAIGHFSSVIVVLPAAICGNFVCVRMFRSRSWRRETWRAWAAGAVGVPLVWIGTIGWTLVQGRPPEFLNRVGMIGHFAYLLGIVVMFSNMAVLIGWLMTSERSKAGV